MIILFTILGLHLLNVFFIFFSVTRIVAKCGLENAYNVRYLLWLFLHPVLNCFTVICIFINGEEGLIEICKSKIEKK